MKTDIQTDAELDQTVEMARAFVMRQPTEAIEAIQETMDEMSRSNEPTERLISLFTNVGIAVIMQAQRRYMTGEGQRPVTDA